MDECVYNKNTHRRRYTAYVSSLGTTQLDIRSPWVTAFWSMMFPGLGHMLLSKYLRGFLLFIWEVVVNQFAHVNLAILYTFTGKFDLAIKVLDIRWFILYSSTFFFAIWDSYRTTVDINNNYILASREDAVFSSFKMDTIEINYLDKKSPWSSVAWSFLIPGTGQLSIHRIVTAFFILIWFIVIVYISNLLPALHYTLYGNFAKANSVLDAQWFLNLPSVYFFGIYDSYKANVESNKLFDKEQAKFLKNNYQYEFFKMPLESISGGKNMYVVSTFEHSIYLEKAITALQMKGVAKENIMAVPMDKRGEKIGLFDSIHHSDGMSLLDLPFILGSFFTLFGCIYGFVLPWGPIVWGAIGFVIGAGLGLVIKLLVTKKFSHNRAAKRASEVVLIIHCKEDQTEMVRDMLWSHMAMGVRRLELNTSEG